MRALSMAIVVSLHLTLAGAANGQYIEDHGRRYQQAWAAAASQTRNAQAVQNALPAQRGWFNRGMASRNPRDRDTAKRAFLDYLGRLQVALLAAENAHGPAIYWGQKYAGSLRQLQRTASQARPIEIQVQALRTAMAGLRDTRYAVQREAQDASRRR